MLVVAKSGNAMFNPCKEDLAVAPGSYLAPPPFSPISPALGDFYSTVSILNLHESLLSLETI
jgi:hypothetical protein